MAQPIRVFCVRKLRPSTESRSTACNLMQRWSADCAVWAFHVTDLVAILGTEAYKPHQQLHPNCQANSASCFKVKWRCACDPTWSKDMPILHPLPLLLLLLPTTCEANLLTPINHTTLHITWQPASAQYNTKERRVGNERRCDALLHWNASARHDQRRHVTAIQLMRNTMLWHAPGGPAVKRSTKKSKILGSNPGGGGYLTVRDGCWSVADSLGWLTSNTSYICFDLRAVIIDSPGFEPWQASNLPKCHLQASLQTFPSDEQLEL